MRRLSGFLRDTRGVAAVEFVLWLSVLTVPVLGATDLGYYTYQRMQVELGAEAAVQAAWHTCNPVGAASAVLPAIVNCTGLATNMLAGAQSTSLSTNITLPSSAILEGYYCANSSGGLTLVGATGTAAKSSTLPTSVPNCSTVVSKSTTTAGDYIQATVTYTYKPIFGQISVATILGTTITKTAWLRLDA